MIHIDAVIHVDIAGYSDGYFQNLLQEVGSAEPDEAHLPDFVSRCCSVQFVNSFYIPLCITFVNPVTPTTLTLPCMHFPWYYIRVFVWTLKHFILVIRVITDQYEYLGNCTPTPPLTHH